MSELQRLKKVINWLIFSELAENETELAKKLGYTKSSFSQIINGKVPLSSKFLNNLSNLDSNINFVWIKEGRGQMLKDMSIESIVSIKPINKDEQDTIISANHTSQSNTNGIPLIPSYAMAGVFTGDLQILEYECERFVIPTFKGADFLIPVKGSSMEPKYSSGDLVACKKMTIDTFFQWNKVYVLDTEQGPLIKRINEGPDNDSLLICSENPKFPSFILSRSLIHNIALVVGVIRLE